MRLVPISIIFPVGAAAFPDYRGQLNEIAYDRVTDLSNPPRVAIIGAGITGLTLAHELSGAGIDVEIYEAGRAIGGELGRG